MAHEIDNSLGFDAFTRAAGSDDAWHGLGNTVRVGASPAEVQAAAGANFAVHASPSLYRGSDGVIREYDARRVLFRNDTNAPLGTVSDRYKIVQPSTLFEFFADEIRDNKLHIDTAGVLRGGQIVFVNAALGREFATDIMGDVTERYLTLYTGFTGEYATSAMLTDLRTVCSNTLHANIGRTSSGKAWRTPHNATFEPGFVKAALGMLGKELKIRADVFNALAKRRVSDDEAARFFMNLVEVDSADLAAGKVSTKSQNILRGLGRAYKSGPGAQLASSDGTAYGLLNAVTYYADHEGTVRDTYGDGKAAARLSSVMLGSGGALKSKALDRLVKLAECEDLLVAA